MTRVTVPEYHYCVTNKTPPTRGARGSVLRVITGQMRWHIHDDVAHSAERGGLLHFGEEVCQVVQSVHVGNGDLQVLDGLTHEEVTAVDVLGLGVMFRVVGQVTCCRVVDAQRHGLGTTVTQLSQESFEVDGV